MRTVAYITNAGEHSGVGHRAAVMRQQLEQLGVPLVTAQIDGRAGELTVDGRVVKRLQRWPGPLGAKSVGWLRLGRVVPQFLSHYALRASRDKHITTDDRVPLRGGVPRPAQPWRSRVKMGAVGGCGVWHFTNQTLSFLARRVARFDSAQRQPIVVTVHDLIEVQEPQDWRTRGVNRYLYSGIRQADHVIAVSAYTARQVEEYYGVPRERITVIYNGVDREVFYPIDGFKDQVAYQQLRGELRLPPEVRVLLYVGSDHPRKNVGGTVQVLAKVRRSLGNVMLIKVGEPGLLAGRERLLREIDRLGLREAVRMVGAVSFERLNELYNLADVVVYPSRFEGFGLPPLQAMAAGTPVVTSTATAIPEVVGEAALMRDPDDVDGLSGDVLRILQSDDEAARWRAAGLARAEHFSWQNAARQVREVYSAVS